MSKRSPDSTSPFTSPRLKHPRMESSLKIPSEQVVFEYLHDQLLLLVRKPPADDLIPRIFHPFIYYEDYFVKVEKCTFLTKDQVEINAKSVNREEFLEILRKAAESPLDHKALRALIFHDVFWTPPPKSELKSESPTGSTSNARDMEHFLQLQNKATEESWNAAFVDQIKSPLDGLVSHIATQLDLKPQNNEFGHPKQPYGRYCSIVQSSGMGKSRLLDEFSKHFFMFPVNLRGENNKGYPPPDGDVRDFFIAGITKMNSEAVKLQVINFFSALFEQTAEILKDMGNCQYDRIINFRAFMTEDQHVGSTGKNRVVFYKKVIKRVTDAEDLGSNGSVEKVLLEELKKNLKTLQNALNSGTGEPETPRRYPGYITPPDSNKFVDVFITFDEAHTLSQVMNDQGESCFVVLRRVLSSISSCPLYAFFLSTTGSVTEFALPRERDPSSRISTAQLSTPRPYIYVGFDQLMQKQKIFARWKTLDDVTSLECAAHMGRPLWGSRYDHGDPKVRENLIYFAMDKLLFGDVNITEGLSSAQAYAVLSQRVALDINMPQYLFWGKSTNVMYAKESEQITNHMRVCVAIHDNIESLHGVASSEPILSEAASQIMLTNGFSLHRTLSVVLSGYCVNQGERGELIVSSFFTWARDQVIGGKSGNQGYLCRHFSVCELFDKLFRGASEILGEGGPSIYQDPDDLGKPFNEVFKNTNMHFNHMIRPHDQKALRRSNLLLFMARGAAALGANGQPGFDAVYPFLYGTTNLDIRKVGFVIVQTKNDPRQGLKQVPDILEKMDPFACKLIDEIDKEDGRFPIPIIRIVFLVSSYDGPCFEQVPSPSGTNSLFTSYDYVCIGIDPKILGPIEASSAQSWQTLVNKREPWESLYKVDEASILRTQIPGGGSNSEHYTSWMDEDSLLKRYSS